MRHTWFCPLALLTVGFTAASCAHAPATNPPPASVPSAPPPAPSVEGPSTILLASDLNWEPLNPARGDASPKAATLWGDRQGDGHTGFLVRFVDGFASPPHIHTVSYRAVVIRGLVHNDDPRADSMWMSPGSFWTQPAGAPHITAAKGESVVYVEIDRGPYLVRPVDEASSNGELPVNVDASNIVWLDTADLGWSDDVGQSNSRPRVAFLWGEPHAEQPHGLLVEVPSQGSAVLTSHGGHFRAVVIEGRAGDSQHAQPSAPGSMFSSDGPTNVSCRSGEKCVFYVRAEGRFTATAGRDR